MFSVVGGFSLSDVQAAYDEVLRVQREGGEPQIVALAFREDVEGELPVEALRRDIRERAPHTSTRRFKISAVASTVLCGIGAVLGGVYGNPYTFAASFTGLIAAAGCVGRQCVRTSLRDRLLHALDTEPSLVNRVNELRIREFEIFQHFVD